MPRLPSSVLSEALPFFTRGSSVFARGVVAKAVPQSSRLLSGNAQGRIKLSDEEFRLVKKATQYANDITMLGCRKKAHVVIPESKEHIERLLEKMDGFYASEVILRHRAADCLDRVHFNIMSQRAVAAFFLVCSGPLVFASNIPSFGPLISFASMLMAVKGYTGLANPRNYELESDSKTQQFLKDLEEHSSIEELLEKLFYKHDLENGKASLALYATWMRHQSRLFFSFTHLGELHIGNRELVGAKLLSCEIPVRNLNEPTPTFGSR